MEVGPLARLSVAYQDGSNPLVKSTLDDLLKNLGRTPAELNSVMGRHAARAVECLMIADRCSQWLDQLQPDQTGFADFVIPETGQGHGLTEAARGSLGHWIQTKNHMIDNYQCIVPTTWNASPRDDRGMAGPIEQALVGTPVADSENPMEVARVVRSFDPCLACAVH
jgi:Ni,Fe-hydrogenase I large subunit